MSRHGQLEVHNCNNWGKCYNSRSFVLCLIYSLLHCQVNLPNTNITYHVEALFKYLERFLLLFASSVPPSCSFENLWNLAPFLLVGTPGLRGALLMDRPRSFLYRDVLISASMPVLSRPLPPTSWNAFPPPPTPF